MILAVLIDGDRRPVCSEMWPANIADVTMLIPVIDRLHRRFAIARVCVVADRGMISAETVAELEALSAAGGAATGDLPVRPRSPKRPERRHTRPADAS